MLVEGMKFARGLANYGPLKDMSGMFLPRRISIVCVLTSFSDGELNPGEDIQDDSELRGASSRPIWYFVLLM